MCLKVLALMLLLTGSLHAYQHSSNMAIASSSAVLRIRHVGNTVFGKNHALGKV